MENIIVTPAIKTDLLYIDSLQRKNAEELSFYPSQVFEREIVNKRLLLAKVNNEPAGYLYHGAFGPIVKIHQACIQYDLRGKLYGAELVRLLIKIAEQKKSMSITLRCGSDIEANGFWKTMGFVCEGITKGGARRMRDINCWRHDINPQLFISSIEPSTKSKSSALWAKHRKLNKINQNSFIRGKGTLDYRNLIERN